MEYTLVQFLPLLCIVGVFVALSIGGHLQERKDHREGKQPDVLQIDTDALMDNEVQAAIASGHKINAIKRYRELTNGGLKEAKDAVEYFEKHPEILTEKKKAPELRLQDSGIRDLIQEGRLDEAVEVYRKFAGVDEYTARDAVEQIKRDLPK
jgi:ribosomal protein L7/L12